MAHNQLDLTPELAVTTMRFVLTSQLAVIGQLASALVSGGALSAVEAANVITKIADAITASLDESSVLMVPMREHAEALRKVADELNNLAGRGIA